MGWFKEGKRGQRPDGFYYLTEEYVQETCNTKEWRRCSEQFTYWKEDFDKRFTEKKVCDKCGKNVRYDPVRKVFMRHWCKKIKLSKLWFLTISKERFCIPTKPFSTNCINPLFASFSRLTHVAHKKLFS